MKISLNWLKDYIDLKGIPEKELLERLTLSTCEVEGVRKLDEHIKKIVVGEIIKIENHPNADKLKVCSVNVKKDKGSPSAGSGTNLFPERKFLESKGNHDVIQVVCGGTNLKEGAKVVVALPEANVKWHGESQWTELKETEIRGVKSFGMICAAEELEIPWRTMPEDGERPIAVLSSDAPVGQSIVEYLGLNDTVLDIDNKSITHRADLFSHVGIATEFGAIFKKSVKDGRYKNISEAQRPPQGDNEKNRIEVRIEASDAVKRYSALLVEGVRVVSSPLWMQNRLRAVGIRPTNNVVDVTNYVMWEFGSPLHAFDAGKIANQREEDRKPTRFIIRNAYKGEKVTTLDGVEHELGENILVAVDGNGQAIDLPGIMGGKASEVDETTSSILLQAAVFDRVVIRKMGLALAHRTDASALYERGVDPNLTVGALSRTFELLKETCPEARVMQVIDEYQEPAQDRELGFDPEMIGKQLGIEHSEKESKEILERLGFGVEASSLSSSRGSVSDRGDLVQTRETRLLRKARNDSAFWKITIPPRRKDVFGFQDICEEVGRIYGYDTIEPKEHIAPLRAFVVPQHIATREVLRDLFCQQNFHEVYQYIFLSERDVHALGTDPESVILVQNPISEDLKYLRPGMLPSFLKTIEKNEGRYDHFSLFEVGKVFFHNSPITLLRESYPPSYFKKGQPSGGTVAGGVTHHSEFFEQEYVGGVIFGGDLKEVLLRHAFGVFDEMVRVLRLPKGFTRQPLEKANEIFGAARWLVSDSSVSVEIGNHIVGVVGMVKQKTASAFGVKGVVVFFEFNLEALSEMRETRWEYKQLPAFPSVLRDIALVVDSQVPYEQVAAIISKAEYLSHFELFDVFSGKGIPEGKKSLAFHLEFSVPDRTLTSKGVDESLKKTLKHLEQNLGASLRS